MKSLVFAFVLALCCRASAQTKPKADEIRLDGIIASVARDGKSFRLEVDTFTLPTGKSKHLAVPKVRQILVSSSTGIAPLGDAQWKLKPAALRIGYPAMATGKGSEAKGFQARSVTVERQVEGRPIDYFVSQTGADAANGSAQAPWRTVQGAINRIPSGFQDEPSVLHIGVGDFGESSDGKIGQLLISSKKNLVITGQGAKIDGGTQISTGEFTKARDMDVVRIEYSQKIEFRNLVIGDDKAWQGDRGQEATIKLYGLSTVKLNTIRIVGPSRETLLDAEVKNSPVALRCTDVNSVVELENVLVTGHGSFIFNPEGKVFSHRVTFARMFGNGLDDHFLFLQTPHNTPRNERRFTFADCIYYEMEGGRGGRRFFLSAGDDGLDKAHFDAPQAGGGNLMVRCRYQKPNDYFTAKELSSAFLDTRNKEPITHGIWLEDDPKKESAGGVRIDNDLQLDTREGYILCAPLSLKSGWTGGFATPFSDPL